MNLKTRFRLAWAVARDVLRAPAMPTGPSGALWGWSYGSPEKETPWGTFDDFAIGGYGGNAVVFGLIKTRMNAFSEARFRFRSLEDKRLQSADDEALNKLAKPWPGATTGELLMRMEIDASLAGNAFVRNAGDRLERLRPDWVTIVSEVERDDFDREVRTVIGYLYEPYGDPDRGVEFYTVDEVAHWSPIPDPIANFRGMSWLTPVLTEVEADNAQTIHRGAYYRNAASPNLILKYAQKLKQEHIDAITTQVHARHGGAENSFKTMVLDVGADPMIVGTALSDSTFSAVQAAGELRIAMASGVPPIVAGLAGGLAAGTHSNYEQAVRQFADMTLRPNWRGACAALSKLVDVPDGMELWFDTADVALLQEGENSQATTFQVKAASISTLIQAGYEPESVGIAVKAGDESLLKHTGLVSVQMHNANEPEQKPEPAKPPAAARAIERRHDPLQKRDWRGRWTDTGADGMPKRVVSHTLTVAAGTVRTESFGDDKVRLKIGASSTELRGQRQWAALDKTIKAARYDGTSETQYGGMTTTTRNDKPYTLPTYAVRPVGEMDDEGVFRRVELVLGEPGDDFAELDTRTGIELTERESERLMGQLDADLAAARVDTGYGPLDVYSPARGRIALRMKDEAGRPTEVEFNRGEWNRIDQAMNLVIDGFDEHDPNENAPEINHVQVKTAAGPVDVNWRGDHQISGYDPLASLSIVPAYDAPWSVVIDGPHMRETFGAMGGVGIAADIHE